MSFGNDYILCIINENHFLKHPPSTIPIYSQKSFVSGCIHILVPLFFSEKIVGFSEKVLYFLKNRYNRMNVWKNDYISENASRKSLINVFFLWCFLISFCIYS